MMAEGSNKDNQAAFQAVVYGWVQGVFFRDFVQQWAHGLGLTGCVRNLPDGAGVEVRAEGERPSLEVLLEHLQAGPPAARVTRVVTIWQAATGGYAGFTIWH